MASHRAIFKKKNPTDSDFKNTLISYPFLYDEIVETFGPFSQEMTNWVLETRPYAIKNMTKDQAIYVVEHNVHNINFTGYGDNPDAQIAACKADARAILNIKSPCEEAWKIAIKRVPYAIINMIELSKEHNTIDPPTDEMIDFAIACNPSLFDGSKIPYTKRRFYNVLKLAEPMMRGSMLHSIIMSGRLVGKWERMYAIRTDADIVYPAMYEAEDKPYYEALCRYAVKRNTKALLIIKNMQWLFEELLAKHYETITDVSLGKTCAARTNNPVIKTYMTMKFAGLTSPDDF